MVIILGWRGPSVSSRGGGAVGGSSEEWGVWTQGEVRCRKAIFIFPLYSLTGSFLPKANYLWI